MKRSFVAILFFLLASVFSANAQDQMRPSDHKQCEDRLIIVGVKIQGNYYGFCSGVMLDKFVALVNKHSAVHLGSQNIQILKTSGKYDLALIKFHPKIVKDLTLPTEPTGEKECEIKFGLSPWPGDKVFLVSFHDGKCLWRQGEINFISRQFIAVQMDGVKKGDSGKALYNSDGELLGILAGITKPSKTNAKTPKLAFFVPARHIQEFLNDKK